MTQKQEFKDILRIGDKDIRGELPVGHALTQIKGSSFMFANAVCKALKLNKYTKIGELPQEVIDKIEDCLRNPAKYGIPSWLFNRRKDLATGEDKHLISSDLDLAVKFDIRMLKRIRSYRGFRHARGDRGLKVKARGQRTRSRGRKGKTIGVVRKKK